MRSIIWLTLAATMLCRGLATAEDEALQPYEAHLPNLEWTESDPRIAYHAALIVDAETGRPLVGATLTGFDEALDPRCTAYAPRLCSAVTNADGVAWMKSPGPMLVDHWLAQADGYAPGYSFGYQPAGIISLVRGGVAAGQIVDVLGKPLAGLELELFCGCPHGPVFARVQTDADGRVRLPRIDSYTMTQVWCVPPRGRASMWDPADLAWATARGQPLVLEPGRTLRGQVVDAADKPVVDVVVRRTGWQSPEDEEAWRGFDRGPAVRTGPDGRFVMPGLGGRDHAEGVLVFAPGGRRVHRRVPDTNAPRLRIVIDDAEPEVGEATGVLVLRALQPEGGFLPRLPQVQAVRDDGVTETLAATPGFKNELPVGRWQVSPVETFAGATFAPFDVRIVAGETASVEVVVWQQPRTAMLGVERPVLSLGEIEIATATENLSENILRLMEGLVHVPRDGGVALHEIEQGQRVLFSPESGGRRRVRVEAVRESVIEFKGPYRVSAIRLEVDGLEVDDFGVEGNRLRTRYVGNFIARIDDEDAELVWRVPVRIEAPGSHVTIDLGRLQPLPRGPVWLSFRTADGRVPTDASLEATYLHGSWACSGHAEPGDELIGPCRIRLAAPDLQPLRALLSPGKHELIWPSHGLTLEAFSPAGERVQSVIMVDGELHRDYGDKPFHLGGLKKGRHRVIVTPLDLRWRGVQLDLSAPSASKRIQFTLR